MLAKLFVLGCGGAVGTIARYLVSHWIASQAWSRGLPWGTFVVNVSGSFILAAVAILLLDRLPGARQEWFLLLGTGFCGGYTTFSTFEWETFQLIRDGSWGFALANVLGSVAAGFLAVWLAVGLLGALTPRP